MKKTVLRILSFCAAIIFILPTLALTFDAYAASAPTASQTATAIAEEGTVLLRNTGVLPLTSDDGIALMCKTQVFGGGGSGWVNASQLGYYAKALSNAAASKKIKSYKKITSPTTDTEANKVVYVITRESTEGEDIAESSYKLSTAERNDIKVLANKYGAKNIVVVLNVGSVMDTTFLIEQKVGAIVVAYYGGQNAGTALANVLTGKVNPSGKTVDTWASDYSYYPSSDKSGIGTFAGDKNTLYTEDVYVGYRYFATFDPEYKKVNYPFGFGLSYTDFEISNVKTELKGDKFMVSAVVRNVGKVSGKEVVQLYFGAPEGKMGAPAMELCGFAKTGEIKPGEYETVRIYFDKEDFSRFDDTGKISLNSYVIEKGEYKLYLGNSIKNASDRGSIYTYNVAEDEISKALTALRDTTLPERLLSSGSFEALAGKESVDVTHFVSSAGSTVIQAEDYSDVSKGATTEVYYVGSDRGFGMGNLSQEGRGISYSLDVEKAGEYYIAFNLACAWDNQYDMFEITVKKDGKTTNQNVDVSMNKTHTDSDGKWFECVYLKNNSAFSSSDTAFYKITLPEGECTLTFRGNGPRFQNFESFQIYSGNIYSDKTTVIEAENFSSSTLGAVSIANGACTAISNAAGNRYVYDLNNAKAQNYYFSLSASNLSSAKKGALEIYVNGEKADALIDLKKTAAGGDVIISNYYTFEKTDAVKLALPEGSVKIELVTTSETVSCIDKIFLCPESAYIAPDKVIFEDNTDKFTEITNTQGKELDTLITFDDLLEDPSKLDSFVSQISVDDLVKLFVVDTGNMGASAGNPETGVGVVGARAMSWKYWSNNPPVYWCADGPAGIRYTNSSKYAIWFPCATMLASTWNTELAELFGDAVGKECVKGGVDIWLAPGVNIHRNPLCGRNFEYYSEDPLVSGMFAAAVTNGVQKHGVSVCVKHYAANNQETNRFGNNSCISVRALREIYLKSFEITVKNSDPMAIMSSYNMINGLHAASSYDLITGVLKDEWGFDGAIFSDWSASMSHISLVESGNTFKSANPDTKSVLQAYKSGLLSREQIESLAKEAISYFAELGTPRAYVEGDMMLEIKSADMRKLSSAIRTLKINVREKAKITITSENTKGLDFFLGDKKLEFANGKAALDIEVGEYELRIRESESNALSSLDGITLSAECEELFTVVDEKPIFPDDTPTTTTTAVTTTNTPVTTPAPSTTTDEVGGVNDRGSVIDAILWCTISAILIAGAVIAFFVMKKIKK